MATTLELTSSAIRLCREQRGTLVAIETHPIPTGADPIEALAAAPLPRPLGRTTILLQHPDMLLRTMVQPPCPPERLDRIVRFELAGGRGDDREPVTVSWHLIRAGGGGDMRVLALVTKQALIDRLRQALKPHDGRLAGLVHPAVGLYHAWRRQVGDAGEADAALLDIGGQQVHLAFAQSGELLLVRSQAGGMDQLAKQIAETQGLPEAEAAKLMARLGKGSPESLHDLIRRQVQQVASLVTNNTRFAKAQLQLERFEPKAVWLSGAGAQVHGFADALKERLGVPVRLLNPFAGVLSQVPAADLDRHAALPSPWTPALGATLNQQHELDAVSEERERAAAFWRTTGALRAAAIAAGILLLLAIVRQELALMGPGAAIAALDGEGTGLVPKAQQSIAAVEEEGRRQAAARAHLAFLDGERRPGRIAVELLTAIAEQQDPQTCRVALRQYRVVREPGQVLVEIAGIAESAPGKSPADVLRVFERQLARAYAPIGSLVAKPPQITADHLEFLYRIALPDAAPRVDPPATRTVDGRRRLELRVAADGRLDPKGVAQVAFDRAWNGEDEAAVVVVDAADAKRTTTLRWSPKGWQTGL